MIEKLDRDGELENTIVIFTSDNGPTHEGHDHEFFNSNGVLKGYKRDIYEGGIRVPMIVYWDGKVEHGTITNHPSAFYDVMPTLAEIAGATPPGEIDGISFLPELVGKEQSQHEYLYWELQGDGKTNTMKKHDGGFRQAMRMKNWKAVRYGVDGKIELYNLNTDLTESNDVSSQNPELVSRFAKMMVEVRNDPEHFPYGEGLQSDYSD